MITMGLYCVMPYNGPLPFLRKKRARDARNSVCANALKRASLISTTAAQKLMAGKQSSANALKRASLISTVGSGNPHKQRLPEPIFTCNSQNILSISIFRPKNGLFTVCSYLTNSLYQNPPPFSISFLLLTSADFTP